MNLPMRFKTNTPNVIYETIDDEVVIIHFQSGNYYSFDKVGGDIWRLIEKGYTVSEIVEDIARRYKGGRMEIENSVNQLVEELQRADLILPDNENKPENNESPIILSETVPEEERYAFQTPTLNEHTDMAEMLLVDLIHEIDDKEVDETNWPMMKPPSLNL